MNQEEQSLYDKEECGVLSTPRHLTFSLFIRACTHDDDRASSFIKKRV
jgi:hypothetical protein